MALSPLVVLTVFTALAVWAGLFVDAVWKKSRRAVLLFGIALMLYLNVGYVIAGVPASIASRIGIYAVLINIGLAASPDAGTVTTSAENACTVWGNRYVNHSAWDAAFYDRFANGPELRSTLLTCHIILNSLAFVLMHVQLYRPG